MFLPSFVFEKCDQVSYGYDAKYNNTYKYNFHVQTVNSDFYNLQNGLCCFYVTPKQILAWKDKHFADVPQIFYFKEYMKSVYQDDYITQLCQQIKNLEKQLQEARSKQQQIFIQNPKDLLLKAQDLSINFKESIRILCQTLQMQHSINRLGNDFKKSFIDTLQLIIDEKLFKQKVKTNVDIKYIRNKENCHDIGLLLSIENGSLIIQYESGYEFNDIKLAEVLSINHSDIEFARFINEIVQLIDNHWILEFCQKYPNLFIFENCHVEIASKIASRDNLQLIKRLVNKSDKEERVIKKVKK
jgi:hypothetical protein